MDLYLEEIGKMKLMTPSEEQKVAEKAAAGDKKAREKLITHNLRYVVEVAKSYQGKGLTLEELIAEGNLGIMKAVDRFDPTRKMKFITYASWWIRQAILAALSENTRLVRIPINRINEIQREKKLLAKELQKHGGWVNENSTVLQQMYSSFPIRIDSSTNSEQPIIDIFENEDAEAPDSKFEEESLRIDLETSMSFLTDREIEVIKYYHGIGEPRSFTLEEIGNILGLTRERIRQIKKKALDTINEKEKNSKILAKYV